MKSSSESILTVVVARVARSDTLFLNETGKLSLPIAVETGSISLSFDLSVLRTLLLLLLVVEVCWSAALRDLSEVRVAALPSFSTAASTAFLFLVWGGVVAADGRVASREGMCRVEKRRPRDQTPRPSFSLNNTHVTAYQKDGKGPEFVLKRRGGWGRRIRAAKGGLVRVSRAPFM